MSTYDAGPTFGARGDVQRAQAVVDTPVVLAVQVVRPLLYARLLIPMLLIQPLLYRLDLHGFLFGMTTFAVGLGTALATNAFMDAWTRIRVGLWSGYLVATASDLVVVRGTWSTGSPAEVTARFPLASVRVHTRQFGLLLELPDGRRARLSVRGISFGTVRADAVTQLARSAGS